MHGLVRPQTTGSLRRGSILHEETEPKAPIKFKMTRFTSALSEAAQYKLVERENIELKKTVTELTATLACISQDYKVAVASSIEAEKVKNKNLKAQILKLLNLLRPPRHNMHIFQKYNFFQFEAANADIRGHILTPLEFEELVEHLELRQAELLHLVKVKLVLQLESALRKEQYGSIRSARGTLELDGRIISEAILRRKMFEKDVSRAHYKKEKERAENEMLELCKKRTLILEHKKKQKTNLIDQVQVELKWKNRYDELRNQLRVFSDSVKNLRKTQDLFSPLAQENRAAFLKQLKCNLAEMMRANVHLQEKLSCGLAEKESFMISLKQLMVDQRRMYFPAGFRQIETQDISFIGFLPSYIRKKYYSDGLPEVIPTDEGEDPSPVLTFLAHSRGYFMEECLREVVGAVGGADVARVVGFLGHEIVNYMEKLCTLGELVKDTERPFKHRNLGANIVALHLCDCARQVLGCSRVVVWISIEESTGENILYSASETPSKNNSQVMNIFRTVVPSRSDDADGHIVYGDHVNYKPDAKLKSMKLGFKPNMPEDGGIGLLGRTFASEKINSVLDVGEDEGDLCHFPDIEILYGHDEDISCRKIHSIFSVPIREPNGVKIRAIIQAIAFHMNPKIPFGVDRTYKFPKFSGLYLSGMGQTLNVAIASCQDSRTYAIRNLRISWLLKALMLLRAGAKEPLDVTSAVFTSLHASSLDVASAVFTSLHASSLDVTSAVFTSLHASSLDVTSAVFTSLHASSLDVTSAVFTSLHASSLDVTSAVFTSLHASSLDVASAVFISFLLSRTAVIPVLCVFS